MKRLDAKGRRCLIIPDTHEPFGHPDYIPFLSAVKTKYLDPSKEEPLIIHLGDEVDGHCISFHSSEPDLPFSPSSELEKAIEKIDDLQQLFPKMFLCESNHGSLVYRRQKEAGLPRAVFKSYQEILQTPGWVWHEDYLLETKMGDIYICHGKTATTGKLAKEMGTYGAVQGHYHGRYQVHWSTTATGERFDAYSGCLIDRQSLAFAYGKNHIPKPILGCLLISKIGYPKMIRMITNENDRWIWELP